MNERHDDLQEIIDAALREMAAEEGDGFDPQACNLAEFCRRTGLTRSRARTVRAHGFRALPHGNSGRRAAPGVLAGHTGLVDDLLRKGVTNSQVIFERLLGQGYAVALQDGARRGLPDGLGLRRGRAPRRGAGADRLLRHGLPPLRGRPRRVLPERAPGEPPHRDAARVLGAGRARDRAHRQHEERGRPPRCRRPARLAGRLRRVHGRRRLPHQVVQAAPPLYEGQGGEARPLREGELPRGKVLYRP